MSKRTGLLVVLVAGVVWGLVEIFVGDVFYRFNIPFRSGSLTAVGLSLLVVSRLVVDRFGTSLGAGLVSGLIRCLVPKAYLCHGIAIALEALAFDAAWTALRAGERQTSRRAWLACAAGVYTGFVAFGAASIYLFKFGRWVDGGWGYVARYVLKSGSFAVLLLVGLAPLAVWAGRRLAAPRTRAARARANIGEDGV